MNIKFFTWINSKNKFNKLNGLYIDLYKVLRLHSIFSENICVVTGGNLDGLMTAGTDLAIRNFFKDFNINIEKDVQNIKLNLGEISSLSYKINNMCIDILYIPTVEHPICTSSYEIIEKSYKNLSNFLSTKEYSNMYIPMLGSGFGRLDFHKVENICLKYFQNT